MDRYVRVEQRKTEQPTIQENEVRIMAAGKMRNYISYATTLLTVQSDLSRAIADITTAPNLFGFS